MQYRIMQPSDYPGSIALWQQVDGVKIRDADSEQGIARYLARNPSLSFVAEATDGLLEPKIIATIMSGHDGKRGYIQHLAVAPNYRKKGVATELVNLCLSALKLEGIMKTHIHVLCSNTDAKQYWHNRGWTQRNDIEVFSYINGGGANT